uniref:Protein kinase domain-containing protein n=1 Tax=Neobodo designis TaxID=312471 RepID=A0A7S1QUH5_NEODS|mmetsp:Transcript_5262/g.16705  ORF Transcript_5262/g.16705 Transcript_5262/m.16705 type:complete len:583 (+) Transcript_5262:29-1777(+)
MSDSDDDGPPPVRQNTGTFHLSPRRLDSGQISPMAFGDRGQSFRLLASNSFALQRVQSMATLEHSLTMSQLSSGVPKDIVRAACSSLRHYISDNGAVSVTDEAIPVNIRQGPRIGSGGYANVYSGINTITGELVAIKELEVGESSPQQFDDVAAEFNLLRRLRHPNVIRYILFEHSLSQKVCRIVMELMAGGSALTLLQNYGPLSESVLRGYVVQILAGLDFIHNNGITHRDIKPANILVHSSGVVKLADFGCSKLITARTSATQNLLGTPVYMAPEFIRGHLHQRSDIWAVGCTILELATGRRPWAETGITDHLPLMFHISSIGHGPDVPATLSPLLREFIDVCFTIDPDQRPSAAALLTHQWLVEGEDDDMCQDVIEQIGAKQTSDLVDSLMTEGLISGSVRDDRPQDAPQQLLLQPEGPEGAAEVQCTSPTNRSPAHVAGVPSGLFSSSERPAVSSDDVGAMIASESGTLESPDGSVRMNGPMHVTFPVAAGSKRMNVELDVQPSDVTVRYIDKRPSFVLNLSEGVRNQLSQAMDALSSKPDDIPTITFGEQGDPMASSGDSVTPKNSRSGGASLGTPM